MDTLDVHLTCHLCCKEHVSSHKGTFQHTPFCNISLFILSASHQRFSSGVAEFPIYYPVPFQEGLQIRLYSQLKDRKVSIQHETKEGNELTTTPGIDGVIVWNPKPLFSHTTLPSHNLQPKFSSHVGWNFAGFTASDNKSRVKQTFLKIGKSLAVQTDSNITIIFKYKGADTQIMYSVRAPLSP